MYVCNIFVHNKKKGTIVVAFRVAKPLTKGIAPRTHIDVNNRENRQMNCKRDARGGKNEIREGNRLSKKHNSKLSKISPFKIRPPSPSIVDLGAKWKINGTEVKFFG